MSAVKSVGIVSERRMFWLATILICLKCKVFRTNTIGLDRKRLDNSFKEFQKNIHPDKNVDLQLEASELITAINQIYKILSDDILRIVEIVSLSVKGREDSHWGLQALGCKHRF